MQELYNLERACAAANEAYDFAQVVRRLIEFANATLSNLYSTWARTVSTSMQWMMNDAGRW